MDESTVKNQIEVHEPKRIFYLDLIRATACMFVIMVHISESFLSDTSKIADFYFSTVINSISHAGVPLFVMISGALILDDNYKFSESKNINHIKKWVYFICFG